MARRPKFTHTLQWPNHTQSHTPNSTSNTDNWPQSIPTFAHFSHLAPQVLQSTCVRAWSCQCPECPALFSVCAQKLNSNKKFRPTKFRLSSNIQKKNKIRNIVSGEVKPCPPGKSISVGNYDFPLVL